MNIIKKHLPKRAPINLAGNIYLSVDKVPLTIYCRKRYLKATRRPNLNRQKGHGKTTSSIRYEALEKDKPYVLFLP